MSHSGRSVYTAEGLRKLSLIVKSAMGDMSYREFEKVSGISHGVIRRIAICDAKMPDRETLQRLAYPVTPYTYEQLQLILMERDIDESDFKQYRTASELFSLVLELPVTEMVQLAVMVINHLGDKYRHAELTINKLAEQQRHELTRPDKMQS